MSVDESLSYCLWRNNSQRGHYIKSQKIMVTESGYSIQKQLIKPSLNLESLSTLT